MESLDRVIDNAAKMCGGQNVLARRIGVSPGRLSNAKAGREPLSVDAIAALAAEVHMAPAELWLIAQDRRNPFRNGPIA